MDYRDKRRSFIAIFILLTIVLFFQGCAPEAAMDEVKNTGAGQGYPMTVKDSLGREVIIDGPVRRIACGYAYTGHVAALLGRAEDIVAVVDGLKRDKVLTSFYPHIKELPVPFSSSSINIEELLTCDPDIVFLQTDTALNESVTANLDKLGIRYMAVAFDSMEEQINSIYTIGKVLGADEEADRYIAYYRKVIEDTGIITAAIPEQERVTLYHSVNEAVRTDLKNSLSADWIRITGAINVSTEDDLKVTGDKSYATLEQIYKWDPYIIIANEAGVPEYMLSNEQWASLRAVKEKRVYQIPNGISRWGHPGSVETPLAILWTAKLLYPDWFKELNMEKEVKEYYKSFFKMDLSNDQVEGILSGKGMREAKTGK